MQIPVLFLTLALATKDIYATDSNLTKLIVVFRHGFRTPVSYPYDVPDTCFNGTPANIAGNLTKLGRTQMSFLGSFLRLHYNSFLIDSGNKAKVFYADSPRCKESAELVFNGLFSEYNSTLDNTTNFFVNNASMDPNYEPYGSYGAWINTLPIKDKFLDLINDINTSNVTNPKVSTLDELHSVLGEMLCETANGCDLPIWMNASIQSGLSDLNVAIYSSFLNCSYDQMIKNNSDGMVSEILSAFNQATSSNVTLYATHDDYLASYLTRMSLFNGLPVPFGASVFFELHHLNNTDIVRVFYDNQTENSTLSQLWHPKCSPDCPLDQFVTLVSKDPFECVSFGTRIQATIAVVVTTLLLSFVCA